WGACTPPRRARPGRWSVWPARRRAGRSGGRARPVAACGPSRYSCPGGGSFPLRLGAAIPLAVPVDLLHDPVPVRVIRQGTGRPQDALAPGLPGPCCLEDDLHDLPLGEAGVLIEFDRLAVDLAVDRSGHVGTSSPSPGDTSPILPASRRSRH